MDEKPQSSDDQSGRVSNVKRNWQQFEDYGLAYKMQNAEFEQHFNNNRRERQQVRGDISISKEEQKLEDVYAAEYFEQLRLDQEREDAKIALELERKLQQEESRNRRKDEDNDEVLARRLNELELQQQAASRNSRIQSEPVRLAPGITPHHQFAIQRAVSEDDRALAIEQQDRELAEFLQKQEEEELRRKGQMFRQAGPTDGLKKVVPPRPPPPNRSRQL